MAGKYYRKWLNPRGNAFVSWLVRAEHRDAELEIGDCNRRVNLEFSWSLKKTDYPHRTKEDAVKKLDLLIGALQAMRAAILGETDGR